MPTPSMQQVCMETSDWLKGIISSAAAADNSTSSFPTAAELIPVRAPPPPPMIDRRLRPPHEQALKCPRCDSTRTKFCYYNNYSLSQPRYFCKTCRRYWTKGGSLRNVPVGGGCRKNKRPSSTAAVKRPPAAESHQSIIRQPTDLQLSSLNFMFVDNVASGYANSLGFSIGHSFADACQRLELPFGAAQEEEEAEAEAVEMKPGNRMLSPEWPEQGCGDSYGYANGKGLWAGMINGHRHGPSSAGASQPLGK